MSCREFYSDSFYGPVPLLMSRDVASRVLSRLDLTVIELMETKQTREITWALLDQEIGELWRLITVPHKLADDDFVFIGSDGDDFILRRQHAVRSPRSLVKQDSAITPAEVGVWSAVRG
jgi:hypothetical protein